jgi:hypothetical protein
MRKKHPPPRKEQLQAFLDRFFVKETHGKFLNSRHALLGNKKPKDMLGNARDFNRLMDMLDGMDAGDFS